MRRAGWLGLAALIGAALLTACGDDQTPATPPPATASADPSPAPTATATPSPGETATPAATAHPTAAPATPSPTPTASATVAASPTPASTATPSPTPTAGVEQVGAALEALPWMRDGVSGDEDDAATTVRYAAEVALEHGFEDLFVTLTERAWVRDGLAPVEISAPFSLVSLAHRHAGATARLLDMPFLTAVETGDLGMLQDLEQIPLGEIGAALASPRLEGGIRDGDEVAVSALWLAALARRRCRGSSASAGSRTV